MTQPEKYKVFLAFGLVYLFWGSTYLGINIAVRHIPPEVMTGIRFLIAGPLMLAWCRWRGRRVKIGRGDALRLAVIGVILLSVSNVTLSYSELVVPSGLASLLVALVPLWLLVIETWILRGDRLTRRGMMGLPLGVAGVAILLWPELNATSAMARRQLGWSLAVVFASLAWAVGSVISKRWHVQVDAFAASAWQMTFAGAVNLMMAGVLGEYARTQWTREGAAAVAYLIVFGSWVGFSAYIWLLQNVPLPKVATYAYVNPVVAVILGWLVLNERVDFYILVGIAIVIAAVVLTTSAKVKSGRENLMEDKAFKNAG
jgi:drug/metabolite transporter (DMT)-like permease